MVLPPSLSAFAAEWLAPLAQAVDEMLWVCDGDGRIVFANASFGQFWGGAAAAQGQAALLARVHADDRAQVAAIASHAGMRTEEYRASRPDGRIARVRERAFRTRDPAGADFVVHVARDISWQFDTTAQLRAEMTRRADAERHLNDATHRLEAMIASANDAVISIDADGTVIDWNHAAERIFGWRKDEAAGRNLTDMIVPPHLRRHPARGIEQYLEDETGQLSNRRVETLALRRSGEEFHAELSVWPVQTAEGRTFGFFIRDISRRKAAERALAESEAKYRKVVENVNEGILVTAGGRILYANPKALELTGLDEETARSHPFIEFIHPDDRDRVLANHLKRLKGEPVENYYQFRVVHRLSGDVRWLEISAVVFEWQNQPATLNFLTDVTARRKIEQDMLAALARERELSELKSRFVAVASHEFRTPLAAILSSIELLDDYGARLPEEERKEIVALVKNAVARMNKMVEQVLLTSRLESGKFTFEPRARHIPDLLVQVASEMDQAHPQAARIAMDCQGLEQPRLVDAKLVGHILVNLLGNSLKYSPPDTPVRCSVRADGDRIAISVADEGIGIPEADLPRLFESFHRGTNVGNIQGTGIGLHIVRECVDLHGGSIEVESAPGQGATFRVQLHAPAA